MNYKVELLTDGHEEIEKNDRRLLESYKEFVESEGREFSIDLLSPENDEFLELKTPFFSWYGDRVFHELINFFHGTGPVPRNPFTQLVIVQTPNFLYFLLHLKEVSPDTYLKILDFIPNLEKVLNELTQLQNSNFIPYLIDFKLDRKEVNGLKSFIDIS